MNENNETPVEEPRQDIRSRISDSIKKVKQEIEDSLKSEVRKLLNKTEQTAQKISESVNASAIDVFDNIRDEAVKAHNEVLKLDAKANEIIKGMGIVVEKIAKEAADSASQAKENVFALLDEFKNIKSMDDVIGDRDDRKEFAKIVSEKLAAACQRILFDPNFWQQINESTAARSKRNAEMSYVLNLQMATRDFELARYILAGGNVSDLEMSVKETSDLLYKLRIADLNAMRSLLDQAANGSLFMANKLSMLANVLRYKRKQASNTLVTNN